MFKALHKQWIFPSEKFHCGSAAGDTLRFMLRILSLREAYFAIDIDWPH